MATTQVATLAGERDVDRRTFAATSLIIGPLIMAIGDLLHPAESFDVTEQTAIVVEQANRWYLAHLLLLVGFAVLVPGLLTLTSMAALRWPRSGQAMRLLIFVGAAGVGAIFASEMMLGRLAMVSTENARSFLEAFQSPQMALPVLGIGSLFFIGAIIFGLRTATGWPGMRLPGLIFLTGILLIVAEIVSGQVVLSQVGNVLAWVGGLAFARRLLRG